MEILDDNHQEFQSCSNFGMSSTLNWKAGWASRPKQGEKYGKKYIVNYRDDFKDMYEAGAGNAGRKRTQAMIWEDLQRKYPDRFDLPSENEIKTEIGQ